MLYEEVITKMILPLVTVDTQIDVQEVPSRPNISIKNEKYPTNDNIQYIGFSDAIIKLMFTHA